MMEKAEEASAGKKYPLSIEQPSRFAQKSIFFLLMLYTDINPIFFGSDEFNSLGSWVPIPELTLGIFGLPVGVYLPIRRSVNKPKIIYFSHICRVFITLKSRLLGLNFICKS